MRAKARALFTQGVPGARGRLDHTVVDSARPTRPALAAATAHSTAARPLPDRIASGCSLRRASLRQLRSCRAPIWLLGSNLRRSAGDVRHRFPRGAMHSDSDEPATAARNRPAWRATIAAPSRRAVPAGAIGGCGQLDPRQGWVFACGAAGRGRRAPSLMTEWSNQQECACRCGRQRVPHADAFTTKDGSDVRHPRGMTLAVRAQSPSASRLHPPPPTPVPSRESEKHVRIPLASLTPLQLPSQRRHRGRSGTPRTHRDCDLILLHRL